MLLDPNLGLVRNIVLPLADRDAPGFNSTPTNGMSKPVQGFCSQPILKGSSGISEISFLEA
jgi:hypothetical protein